MYLCMIGLDRASCGSWGACNKSATFVDCCPTALSLICASVVPSAAARQLPSVKQLPQYIATAQRSVWFGLYLCLRLRCHNSRSRYNIDSSPAQSRKCLAKMLAAVAVLSWGALYHAAGAAQIPLNGGSSRLLQVCAPYYTRAVSDVPAVRRHWDGRRMG